MSDYTIALEGCALENFSGGVASGTWIVLGATPYFVFTEGHRPKWGARSANTTQYTVEIEVVFDIFRVTSDGDPDPNFGTLVDLAQLVAMPFVRIVDEGTVLPRLTVGGVNFWTDETIGYVRAPRPVVRAAWSQSADYEGGCDRVTIRFRDVDPNTLG